MHREAGRWADVIRQVLEAPGGEEVIEALATYWLRVSKKLDAEKIQNRIIEVVPKAKDAVMTAAEKLEKRGEARGIHLGQAGMLLRLLAKKFGDVPEATEQRVQAASEDDLNRWADRILVADSLEAVFAKE